MFNILLISKTTQGHLFPKNIQLYGQNNETNKEGNEQWHTTKLGLTLT